APINCPICREQLDGESECSALTSCGHVFHASCVSDWLAASQQKICPACRAQSRGRPLRLFFSADEGLPSLPHQQQQQQQSTLEQQELMLIQEEEREAELHQVMQLLHMEQEQRRLAERQSRDAEWRATDASRQLTEANRRCDNFKERLEEAETELAAAWRRVSELEAAARNTAASLSSRQEVGSEEKLRSDLANQQEQNRLLAMELDLVSRTLALQSG
ncbi:hypothetical protein BOX15_Mlig001038g5, partial [Macrostomum lignano]